MHSSLTTSATVHESNHMLHLEVSRHDLDTHFGSTVQNAFCMIQKLYQKAMKRTFSEAVTANSNTNSDEAESQHGDNLPALSLKPSMLLELIEPRLCKEVTKEDESTSNSNKVTKKKIKRELHEKSLSLAACVWDMPEHTHTPLYIQKPIHMQ